MVISVRIRRTFQNFRIRSPRWEVDVHNFEYNESSVVYHESDSSFDEDKRRSLHLKFEICNFRQHYNHFH